MSPAATALPRPPESPAPYRLRSELVRSSLAESATRVAGAWVTWVNSLCWLFLLIGILGRREPGTMPEAPAVPWERTPMPALFRPPPPASLPSAGAPSVASMAAFPDPEPPVAPAMVAAAVVVGPVSVTLPAIVETTVAPASRALPVPPAADVSRSDGNRAGMEPATGAPSAAAADRTTVFRGDGPEGVGGEYPAPMYPREARRRGESGEVRLRVEVDPGGRPVSVDIGQSSGSSLLDRTAAGHVKRFWRWPPGKLRRYVVPIEFRLE